MKTSSLQLPSLVGTLSTKSMLQSAPKHVIFIQNFLGRGHSPSPDPSPAGGDTPPAPTPSAPAAPRSSRLRRSLTHPHSEVWLRACRQGRKSPCCNVACNNRETHALSVLSQTFGQKIAATDLQIGWRHNAQLFVLGTVITVRDATCVEWKCYYQSTPALSTTHEKHVNLVIWCLRAAALVHLHHRPVSKSHNISESQLLPQSLHFTLLSNIVDRTTIFALVFKDKSDGSNVHITMSENKVRCEFVYFLRKQSPHWLFVE